MKFTNGTLKNLESSGKEIGIFSKEATRIIKKYPPKNFKNFQSRSYYYWVSGKRAIPLSIILKLMKNKKSIHIDFFSVGGGNRIKFPDKLSKKLAYVLGLILGDGCLVRSKRGENKNTYYIQISFREKNRAIKTKDVLFELFNISSKVYQGRGCFNVCSFSKPLVILLNKEYEIPIGKKYNFIKVPEKIKNSSSHNKKFFIKGVFESDGNIYTHRGKKVVQLRQKSGRFLDEIKELLIKEKIEFNSPYKDKANNSWVLWSSKKELVDNFIKKIVNLELKPG